MIACSHERSIWFTLCAAVRRAFPRALQDVCHMHSNSLTAQQPLVTNGTGCHCEVVTRRETGDVLRYREYGPASRRYSV
eukprot:365984-Chlamydomonas_euryale.AAC.4